MINQTIEWCLNNRFLVISGVLLICFFGYQAMIRTPVDAIPDIGELQVIVFADWPGRSPSDIEDQVIYPLTTKLLGIPRVKVVRSSSAFSFGMVNIIFEDGKFTWEDRCTLCLRCYNLCPEEAIQYKKATLDREKYTRYKGPGNGFNVYDLQKK